MSNTSSTQNFINLHTTGLGYLNRVRFVDVKKSSFWACDITAMHGDSNDSKSVTYIDFQVNSANTEVDELLQAAQADLLNKSKVKVAFKIGDIYPETFEITKGPNVGKLKTVLKGRLILVTHIWVDSQLVFERGEQGENLVLANETKEPEVLMTEYESQIQQLTTKAAIDLARKDVLTYTVQNEKSKKAEYRSDICIKAGLNKIYRQEVERIWPKSAQASK